MGVEGEAKLPLLMIIIVGETLHVGPIPRLLPCFVQYVTKNVRRRLGATLVRNLLDVGACIRCELELNCTRMTQMFM